MKENLILIVITVLFIATGLVLSLFALRDYKIANTNYCKVGNIEYREGEEIPDYHPNNKCVCGADGYIECVPEDRDETESFIVETEDLETEGLEFEYSYFAGIGNNDSDLNLSPVAFSSVSLQEGKFTIVLEQTQVCPESNIAPEQVGFYERSESILKLYNMVRPVDDKLSTGCVVQLKYTFENFADLDLENMKIAFIDDIGNLTYATICIYNQKVYSDKDIFKNTEGDICTCINGDIDCE